MLFIGGISQGRKLLNYARSILCGSCGSTSQCQVFMTYMYFSFFFIPLFKWNKRFYVQMSCCSAIYELEPEIGKAILRGEEPAITSADLHLVQEGKYTRTWQEGSGNPHKSVCAADLRQTKIITTVRSVGDGYKERLRKTSAALSGICFLASLTNKPSAIANSKRQRVFVSEPNACKINIKSPQMRSMDLCILHPDSGCNKVQRHQMELYIGKFHFHKYLSGCQEGCPF